MSNQEIKQALISSTHPDALDQLDRFLVIEREFNLEIIEADEWNRFCRRLLLDNPWINARSELEDLRADIDRIDTAAQKEMSRMQEIIDALKAENKRLRKALLPFSKLLKKHHSNVDDLTPVFEIDGDLITIGDLRLSYKLLNP